MNDDITRDLRAGVEQMLEHRAELQAAVRDLTVNVELLIAQRADLLAILKIYVEDDDVGQRIGTATYKAARAIIARIEGFDS